MAIDISVVVPVLNAAPYLKNCLEALTDQTLAPDRYEVVVVDNGSTDASSAIAKAHPRVRQVSHAELDPYLARNAGVRAAIGNIVAFTDAHCLVEDTWLSVLLETFSERGVDLVVGSIGYPRDGSRLLRLYETYHQSKMRYVFEHDMQSHLSASCANLAVRKHVFEEVGCFAPLPIPGDTELVHRLRGRSPVSPVRYLPEPTVRRQSVRTLREMLSKTRKHAELNHALYARQTFHALSWRDKKRVYDDCRTANGLSWVDSGLLLYALVLGVGVFEWGQWEARRSR